MVTIKLTDYQWVNARTALTYARSLYLQKDHRCAATGDEGKDYWSRRADEVKEIVDLLDKADKEAN